MLAWIRVSETIQHADAEREPLESKSRYMAERLQFKKEYGSGCVNAVGQTQDDVSLSERSSIQVEERDDGGSR